MEYKFNKPTDNMMRVRTNRFGLMRQAYSEQFEKESEEAAINESATKYGQLEANKIVSESARMRMVDNTNRTEFLSNVKKSLLSECMFKLFKESSVTPLTKKDKVVATNLINNFINENGVSELLRNFKTKNFLLSEMNRITNKYYQKVLESCDKAEEECYEKYSVDPDIKDDFYEELEDLDSSDASKLIKERVADAMDEFIDDNMSNKMDYEDIIKSAKDKMDTMKDEDMMDECANRAFVEVNTMKHNRTKNIFNCMVEKLAKSAYTNDSIHEAYFNESTNTIDMESVVNSCQLMYTMLEMVNTTNMIQPITAEKLNKYLDTL